jgi:hypothetical protein
MGPAGPAGLPGPSPPTPPPQCCGTTSTPSAGCARFAAVLTGITPFDDPWQGKAATHVANETAEKAEERRDGLATSAIPPATWWPLLRADWGYIHLFAPTCWICETGWPRTRRNRPSGQRNAFRSTEVVDQLESAVR